MNDTVLMISVAIGFFTLLVVPIVVIFYVWEKKEVNRDIDKDNEILVKIEKEKKELKRLQQTDYDNKVQMTGKEIEKGFNIKIGVLQTQIKEYKDIIENKDKEIDELKDKTEQMDQYELEIKSLREERVTIDSLYKQADSLVNDVSPSVRRIYGFMEKGKLYSFSDIQRKGGFSNPTVSAALRCLVGKNLVKHDIDNRVYVRIL